MLQAEAVLYLFLKISMAILENSFHGTENIASQVSSCYRLKLQLNFSVRTSLQNPLDISY